MTSREQTFTSAADTIPTLLQSPKKHPGERLANYFDNFFATIVAISTLGASITFSKILQTPVEPWTDYGFSKDTVQDFIAISWLCFALDLIITSFAASALSLYRPQAITYFGTSDSSDRRIVLWYATLVSAILFGLALVAFIFLALTVTAYAGPIGWAAVGFTVFFGALGFGSIIWQSPIGSRSLGIDINRTNSWKRQPNQFPEYQSSPEKEQNGFAGAVLTGDEFVVKGDAVLVRARYVDDRLSRGNTVPQGSMVQQPARPLSGGVPQYTAEMRRMRAASRTTNDVRTSGERQNRPLERNDTRMSYDEKDYGYDEEADPEIWVPANETRRKYDNGKL